MEYINSLWQVGVIALVVGAMIGALAYRYFSPSVRQSEEIKSELDHAKRQLSNYKASVNSHFEKTSELVNDLTQNYVKVYQHLAEGAQTLGDSRELNNLLEQHQGKVLLTVGGDGGPRENLAGATPEATPSSPEPEATAARERVEDADDTVSGDEENAVSALAGKKVQSGGEAADENESKPKAAAGDDTPVSSGESAGEAGPRDPVIDVDKIDRAGEHEAPARTKTASMIAEPTEGIEVPTTRH